MASLYLGCAGCQPSRQGVLPVSSPPAQLTDGWQVSSLAAEMLEPARLAALEQSILAGDFAPPDALLIARNGRLVYEQYWNGFGPGRRHDLRSATKSITSLLMGVAVEQQLIPSTEATVLSFFPQHQALTAGEPRWARVTLAHLLSMSGGMDCDDWNADSPGKEERMYKSDDWLRFVFGLSMLAEPGSRTAYCTGGVELLGGVLAQASGGPVPEFAARRLFTPLQITDVQWAPAAPDGTDTGGHLQLRPRDLLKIGQLMVDEGRWGGEQLVPSAWIADATRSRVHLADSDYGWLWWRNTFRVSGVPFDAVFARGNGGQYLFSFPAQKLTALFMGSQYDSPLGDQAIELCARFVLSATLGQSAAGTATVRAQ